MPGKVVWLMLAPTCLGREVNNRLGTDQLQAATRLPRTGDVKRDFESMTIVLVLASARVINRTFFQVLFTVDEHGFTTSMTFN